jgi:hypothetical protein
MKNHPRFRSRIPAFLFNLSGLFAWIAISSLLAAAPTVEREWTSTAGSTLKAVAESVSGGKVHFKASTGRKFDVPLDKLVEADRAFLAEHFADQLPKPGEPQDSGAAPAEDLAQPQGEAVGPLETPEGSKYHLYIPKSLKKGRKAPLLFYTTPKLEAAAKKLSEQYTGIPEIEEIALNIGQKTGGF